VPFPQPSTFNHQLSTDLNCKTHCPKPSGDVISLCHETEANGTPASGPARFRFRKKNQNDQNQNLTKIISRSFGCGSHQKTANFQMQRDRVEHAPNRARLDVTSLHGRLAVPLMRVR
jgi:hypothetical protein